MNGRQMLTLLLGLMFAALFHASAALDEKLRSVLVLTSLAVAAWPVYELRAGSQVSEILKRALTALIPIGVLALLICFGIDQAIGLNDVSGRVLAAAVVVAAGWIAGFVTQELRRTDLRSETRTDLTRALEVEVGFVLKRMTAVDWSSQKQTASRRFRANHGYVPFVSLKLQRRALDKIEDQIELPSVGKIEPVSTYVHLLDEIDELTEKIASETYSKLDAYRREQIFLFWLDLQADLSDQCTTVLEFLRKPLGRNHAVPSS